MKIGTCLLGIAMIFGTMNAMIENVDGVSKVYKALNYDPKNSAFKPYESKKINISKNPYECTITGLFGLNKQEALDLCGSISQFVKAVKSDAPALVNTLSSHIDHDQYYAQIRLLLWEHFCDLKKEFYEFERQGDNEQCVNLTNQGTNILGAIDIIEEIREDNFYKLQRLSGKNIINKLF